VNFTNIAIFICTNDYRQLFRLFQLTVSSVVDTELRNEIVFTLRQFKVCLNEINEMVQLYASNSNYLMGLLNQTPFQELFPVLIRNIRVVLYSKLFTVKTGKSFEIKF